MHGACAAQGHAATEFGAGHLQLISQKPKQWRIGRNIGLDAFAVNGELDHVFLRGRWNRGGNRRETNVEVPTLFDYCLAAKFTPNLNEFFRAQK
jgi:hypothetical protein